MSVDDVATIRSITLSLRAILDKASTINTADTIEPPLPISSLESDVRNLENIFETPDDGTSKDSRFAVFEYAARAIFYPLVAANLDEGSFISLCNFFDLLQLCADHNLCEGTLPLLLIEELLDGQTIDGCRRVFDYLESRRERLVTNGFRQGIKLVVLRTCNELLRRLSRAEDAVFCGRVFMFLFQSFPLGDKSAVNLRGEFHTENVTVFDETVGKSGLASDEMDVDTEVKQEVQEAKAPPTGPAADIKTKMTSSASATPTKVAAADTKETKQEEPEMDMDTLYTKFWSLQRLFSDPRLAFSNMELDTFKIGLEATLKKFKSVPKILQTRGTPRPPHDQQPKGLKRKRSAAGQDEFASNFNPKYLTNHDLFELEISDLTFQRHILVQALIFLDFLLALTPQAKKRLAKLKVQKALSYDYTLSSENTEWAVKIRGAIADYLQEGPDGKYYYRMIDNVLSRDRNWVRWKVESCPPISLPPLDTKEYLNARKGAKNHCKPRRIRASVLGAMDMSFISDTGSNEDGLAKLRTKGNKFEPPDIKRYISTAREVDLDMEMAKKEDKPELVEKRASNTWRVLRVTAKSRLSLFDEVDESGDLDLLDEEKMATKKAEEEEAAAKVEAEVREEEIKREAEVQNGNEDAVMKEDTEAEQQDDVSATAQASSTTSPNEQQTTNEQPSADEQEGGNIEQLVASQVIPPVTEVDGKFAAEILENVPEGGGIADVLSPGEEDGGLALALDETTAEREGEDTNMVG